MIREAKDTDVTDLLGLCERFYSENEVLEVPFCEKSVGKMLETLINDDNAVIFVDDRMTGTIGGMVYPYWINTQYLTGNELFWWVDKHARGQTGMKLLRKLEKWAQNKGATLFNMIALDSSEPRRLEKIYERRGYIPLERHFVRAL